MEEMEGVRINGEEVPSLFGARVRSAAADDEVAVADLLAVLLAVNSIFLTSAI